MEGDGFQIDFSRTSIPRRIARHHVPPRRSVLATIGRERRGATYRRFGDDPDHLRCDWSYVRGAIGALRQRRGDRTSHTEVEARNLECPLC